MSLRYYPFSDGYQGLQFFLRGRMMVDVSEGESIGSFQAGIAWTPRLSLVPVP